MAISILDMLGTDSVGGSRAVINSNMITLKNAINDLLLWKDNPNGSPSSILFNDGNPTPALTIQLVASTGKITARQLEITGLSGITNAGAFTNTGNITTSGVFTATGVGTNILTGSLEVNAELNAKGAFRMSKTETSPILVSSYISGPFDLSASQSSVLQLDFTGATNYFSVSQPATNRLGRIITIYKSTHNLATDAIKIDGTIIGSTIVKTSDPAATEIQFTTQYSSITLWNDGTQWVLIGSQGVVLA